VTTGPPDIENVNDAIEQFEARAQHLNRRLAETFGGEERPYDAAATPDRLFAYGVLGGKDVGKSTLINALAGSNITNPGDVLGEGTLDAAVYVHEKDLAAWHERCTDHQFVRPSRMRTHTRDMLRNVVLVDLPDFDSRFAGHLSYVRDFQGMLDGILWLATPQKYKDRLLQEELRRVHREGFMFVMNKADWVVETRKEATADELRESFIRAIGDALGDNGAAGDDAPDTEETSTPPGIEPDTPPRFKREHVFIISAQKKTYDYPRLQQILVREHSPAEIARRKALNYLRALAALLADLDAHFALRRGAAGLESLMGEIPGKVNAAFGAEHRQGVLEELTELPEPHRRQSSGLLYHRLESWPIMRMMLWPIRTLIGYFAGRLAHRGTRHGDYDALAEILDAGARPLTTRLDDIREAIELEHRVTLDWIEANENVARPPGGEERDIAGLIGRLRGELLHHDRKRLGFLKDKYPPPGRLGRMLVWFPPLWFFILQPLGNAFYNENKSWLKIIFPMFGAAALLEAFVLLILMYVVWVVKVYADCARWVGADRRESIETFWDEHFLSEVAAIWRNHYGAVVRQTTAYRDEWETLSASVADLQSQLRNPSPEPGDDESPPASDA
jgi:hypothetical protein